MIAVVWRAATDPHAGAASQWACAGLRRTIVEFSSPRRAWAVAVIDTDAILPTGGADAECSGLISQPDVLRGLTFARHLFDTCQRGGSRPFTTKHAAGARGMAHRRLLARA